jgi:hypothetical protein
LSTISSWFIRNDYWFPIFRQIGVQSEKLTVVGQLIEIGSLSNFEAGIFMSLIFVALIPTTFILIFFFMITIETKKGGGGEGGKSKK